MHNRKHTAELVCCWRSTLSLGLRLCALAIADGMCASACSSRTTSWNLRAAAGAAGGRGQQWQRGWQRKGAEVIEWRHIALAKRRRRRHRSRRRRRATVTEASVGMYLCLRVELLDCTACWWVPNRVAQTSQAAYPPLTQSFIVFPCNASFDRRRWSRKKHADPKSCGRSTAPRHCDKCSFGLTGA